MPELQRTPERFSTFEYQRRLGQTRARMEAFRGLGGVQSYPSRTKDTDDVDFSTGSVGLGVAMTGFASMVVNPFDSMQLGSAVRENRIRREAASYLTACGLAMRRFVQ